MIGGGEVDLCCQTELMIGQEYLDPALVNQMCRNANVKYISSQTFGPWGYLFTDFGPSHTIIKPNSESTDTTYIITNITTNTTTTIITLFDDEPSHTFSIGDTVILSQVNGMHQINNSSKPLRVLDINCPSKSDVKTGEIIVVLEVDIDTRQFGQYENGGLL